MGEDARLEWVAKNRRRESIATPIGSRVAGLVDRIEQESMIVEKAIACVGAVVDREFCELCRIEGIEKGVLKIGVAQANAAASLSRKWTGKLREALPAKLKIKRIAFVYGTRGHRID